MFFSLLEIIYLFLFFVVVIFFTILLVVLIFLIFLTILLHHFVALLPHSISLPDLGASFVEQNDLT